MCEGAPFDCRSVVSFVCCELCASMVHAPRALSMCCGSGVRLCWTATPLEACVVLLNTFSYSVVLQFCNSVIL